MIDDFNDFERNVLKLLYCIATMRRGWTHEQRVYMDLVERVLFPEVDEE